ncbi:hypothetical protein [Pseudarthrobacter sp. NamE5]|uniref:hypothetical protein n=1 Tax=Pseudarthrobacter sp. NamE5 TaxID=2576839 RepID=UPI00110A2F8F|nr:hypothetical protein [Pseudarthrobacter sp. NamE5]TLM80896.1 hypothetical protein FDW84_18835 [Pseudarthrobacter sp. NamE5]
MNTPTIALISATNLAIGPAQEALQIRLPDYELWNILDDRLLVDAQAHGKVTSELHRRMNRLIDHALAGKARGILLTCSLYGFVTADYSRSPVPVLPPDEAAFKDVTRSQARGVLVLASIEAAARDSADRLSTHLQHVKSAMTVLPVTVPEAAKAAHSGDRELLADMLTNAVSQAPAGYALLLAQYSLAPAVSLLAERTNRPVFSGPSSAAKELAAMLHT